MKDDPQDDPIERWWAATPENKLELIDGRLVVSTPAGSRRVAWHLLYDHGPAMALPMASPLLWWEALRQAFDPRPVPRTPTEWAEWAATFEWDPEPPPAGLLGSVAHRRAYELLQHGLYSLGAQCLGRDFVVRLGEDGLTPDLLVLDRASRSNLHEYYLDGPPPLVIEITLEGSVEQDLVLKRRLYEQAGVPEYWLIDAADQKALFLRLGADGHYQQAAPDPQGIYRSTAVPELALSEPHLWTMEGTDWGQPCLPFLAPAGTEDLSRTERLHESGGLGWDTLPFKPKVGLRPVPIRFAEFISWCPRAKFENLGAGLVIDGSEGTRRCLGMLLMTLGLVEAVKLATPREWVAFLHRAPHQDLVRQRTAAIMARAEYSSESNFGGSFVYGRFPENLGVSAAGDTLAECQRNLAEVVGNRVLLGVARGQDPAEIDPLA